MVTPYRDDVEWELRVPRGAWLDARFGDVVVALVSSERRQPKRGRVRGPKGRRALAPLARVVEVLGPPGTPEADFRAIAWRHRLPREFPEDALAEAAAPADSLDPAEIARRLDLRRLPFVTIDPATARDHDDAVCVETPEAAASGSGWRSPTSRTSCPKGGALDSEARRRGNSVYFPDRAIPMLPERLSGELCSLRPGVDRLALAVELTLDARGALQGARFHEAVIRSRARLVYEDAARVMEGEASADVPGGEVTEQLQRLAVLALRLSKRRFAAGAIDFDLPSAEIVLGDEGHPTDIVEAPRTLAHRAIEEAMLLANRAVAEQLVAAEVPALYRVHEAPTPTALGGAARAARSVRTARPAARRAVRLARDRRGRAARCGPSRGEARPLHGAALDAPGALRRALSRTLRAGLRRLPAFHVADPPLRRSGRAPRVARHARVTTPKRVRGRRRERSGWRPGRCARRSASARRWKPSARPST